MSVASLVERVRSWMHRYAMTAPGETVIVGVSGGPDSLCLLHVLERARADLGIALHVAHLDHRLRGAESAADAAFVTETAHAWGLPVTVEAIDVGAVAKERRMNLHQAARTVRYAFFARLARALDAQAVAVAHTANDQAETVLMHLLRGAGPAGLRGMRPVVPWEEWAHGVEGAAPDERAAEPRPALIRPLLAITRDEIERYCADHHLQPRRDPTNRDLRYMRNRIRHDLLPQLIAYNPHIVAALGRTATLCAEEHDFIQRALDAIWPTLVRRRAGALDFVGHVWCSLHPVLQREALRRAYALLGGSTTLDFERIEAARAAVGRGVGRRIELPGGLTLTVDYAGSFTLGAAPEVDGPQLAQPAVPLPVPGRVELEHGWAIEATPHPAPAPTPASAWEVYLDADALAGQLVVRRRRPGDRVRPVAGAGSRRLQEVFVDAKVPRALRDAWPLVATPEAIVWVAGVFPAAGFVATPETRRVLRVRVVLPADEQGPQADSP